MKVVNKKMCVIVILVLVIIESCTLFLMYKSFSNKNTNLDEVNLNINNSNMFAIMLEQDDGTYKEDTSNTWPTSGYTYNESMSGCIDLNGNKLDGVLSYDSTNNIATVDTGNTSYCYLYFSLPPYASQKSEMWDSPLEGDGYRYVGENPNNYICFGTTDKTTCTNNMDLYMYRIIGIFEDDSGNEHLKLIKKGTLDKSYAWHSNFSAVTYWDESDLYKGLNGNYFLTNTTYSYMQDVSWTNKIEEWNWTATNTLTDNAAADNVFGIDYFYETISTIYYHELNRDSKTNQICHSFSGEEIDCNYGNWKKVENTKIGLIYVSDFALSLGNNTMNLIVDNNIELFQTGWVFFMNEASSTYPTSKKGEWTMTIYSNNYWGASAYVIYYDEPYYNTAVTEKLSVRPVFYLKSDVKITGGTGTSTDPYIIN